MTFIIAACDKPEAKPPTNIEKDDKADTDTDSEGESSGGNAGETGGESGGESVTPPPYSFAFDTASHKIVFTAGTYTKAVGETNKPAGDARAIEYTSSETKIATVDDAGVVTFIKTGTVTITATKAAEAGHEKATASYELTITKMKPGNKAELVAEITRAMDAHGTEVDLNYIDVSDITDMSYLFSSHASGYGRQAFNGDISEWDVGKVAIMSSMFQGATAFNQDISEWDVSGVENMIGMFFGATMFNQNLDAWAGKLNALIKVFYWQNTNFMFKDSGLADSLPSWCKNTACKNGQS